MAFVWSLELATGNASIDNQHKMLIDALNALVDAHRNGKGRQAVERTMEFLVGYTVKHFADEEKLQKKHGYPDYSAHKQAHVDFAGVVQALAAELSRNGPTDELISEVYVVVSEWLLRHIKGEDYKMAAYVKAQEQTA